MPWAKLDDNFYSNPKVIKATPLARSLYVAGLCHCSGGLTDGQISKAALPLLIAQTGAPRTAARNLVQVGLWHDDGDHYTVNDWAYFNQTAADISERRKAEREKKARQRANGAAKVTNGPGGRFVSRGDTPGDNPRDTPRDNPGESRGESPATRPDPTSLTTSSDNFKGVEPAVAGAEAPPEEGSPPNPETTARLAIEHMGRCDLAAADAKGTPIRQRTAYLAKLTESRRTEHHQRLLELAHQQPTADPVTLAEQIDPACGPDDGGLARARARAAATEAEHEAKQRATDGARANQQRARRILANLDPAQREAVEAAAQAQVAEMDPMPERIAQHITTQRTLAIALERHADLEPETAA